MKFAIKFSISPKSTVSPKNLEGGLTNFFPIRGLGAWEGLGNFCRTGGLSLYRGLENLGEGLRLRNKLCPTFWTVIVGRI